MKTETEISVSPSSLDRVVLCGASAVESAKVQAPTTQVQIDGTHRHHALGLAIIQGEADAKEYLAEQKVSGINNVLTAKGQLNDVWGGQLPAELYIERKFDLAFLGMRSTGRDNEWQGDICWIQERDGERYGYVVDYKSGNTDYGRPEDSQQFKSYLAALVKEENLVGGYVGLLQPAKFAKVQMSGYMDAAGLQDWAAKTSDYLGAIRAGELVASTYNPSPEACGWCAVKHTCLAAKDAVQERKDARDEVAAQALALGGASRKGEAIEFRHGLPEIIIALDAETVANAMDLESRALSFGDLKDAKDADDAGKLLQLITKTEGVVEVRRKEGKRPIIDLSRAWDTVFDDGLSPLARAKTALKGKLEKYVLDQEAAVKAAEDERLRLEKEHAKEAAAAAKKGKPAPTPPPPPPPVEPPRAVAGMKKPKKVLKFEILDLTKAPKTFLQTVINEPLVAAAVKAGQIPVGVNKWIKVWEDTLISSK